MTGQKRKLSFDDDDDGTTSAAGASTSSGAAAVGPSPHKKPRTALQRKYEALNLGGADAFQ